MRERDSDWAFVYFFGFFLKNDVVRYWFSSSFRVGHVNDVRNPSMSVSDSAAKAELTQAEVYAPRSLQLWRTLLNWLAFFFQIFLQILRGTPSVTQVLSYVGLRHHSLLPSSPSFKPLPVVELPELEPPPDSVQINATDGTDSAAAAVDRPAEKFTVWLSYSLSRFSSCCEFDCFLFSLVWSFVK